MKKFSKNLSRVLWAYFLLFGILAHGQEPKLKIKDALADLKKHIENKQPLDKNPLETYQFDSFSSQAYLLYYRALGFSLMANNKNASQKRLFLNRALTDLRLAQRSPGIESQRIEQLVTAVLKELVDLAFLEKKYALIINLIDQLAPSDKHIDKYIIYYAYALFNISKYDDFRKLVSKYPKIFIDEKIILSNLPSKPRWELEIAKISLDPQMVSMKPVLDAPKYTKNALLENPQFLLGYLDKSSYFSDAESIFKLASPMYFSLAKKINSTSLEGEFVRIFGRLMSSFAPNFLDELIMTHWKQADLPTAQRLSEAFFKHYEGHSLYPKVLYNYGRIQEDAKNYTEAFDAFKRFLAISDNAAYDEFARFRAGWVLHLAKKEAQAKPYFAEYVKKYPEGRYASTCEYFLVKASGSHELAQNFIKKYPLNLYSYILADEFKLANTNILDSLSLENNLKSLGNKFNGFKADIKTLAQLKLIHELLDFGLNQDAIKVLKSFPAEHNDLFGLYLAAQLRELNDTHGEVSNLVKVFSNAPSLRKYIPWKSLFPQYNFQTIEKELASQNLKLSTFFVLSIIRQESMFEPKARSTANAQGLMQLTKNTAQQAAQSLGLKDYSLLKEEENIKLGIKTFSQLLKKFDNRLDYALSAYNAGETPTRLWIKLRGHLAPIDFIESIPYQETRQYVKNILRNYAVYKMIYNQQATTLVSYNN